MTMPLLTSPRLLAAGFLHAFSTRAAGDFALQSADRAALAAAQDRLARLVGFEPSRLFQVTQVHGAHVIEAAKSPDPTLEADAIVGTMAGDAVAVRIADCVPILIADPATGRVAAVHAGWRGVEAEIVRAAIQHFPDASRLVAAIGPAIGPCCFEVGVDVADRIARASIGTVVDRRSGDKAFVDLRHAVRAQLTSAGVTALDDVGACTSCDARFHSYRRDREASGRLIAVIVARSA